MAIVSKAPGRICVFGDHQDYLGLPVIACAINRYVTVSGEKNSQDHFLIKMPDIGEDYVIRFRENKSNPHTRHLIDTLAVVARYGCHPDIGHTIKMTSNVPINAGLSSSSALIVAWVQWLLHSYGCDRDITPKLIGQLAYEAEVLEKGAPGGKMDQFTSAMGGMIFLETDERSSIEKLTKNMGVLIIGESGIPKDTEGLLATVKKRQLKAIESMQKSKPSFDVTKSSLSDYEAFEHALSIDERPYIYAAIKNHLITCESLALFRESKPNLKKIGVLMTEHHQILKNNLKITVPRIDQMITAALKEGALGAKIVGSGGGGSIVAMAPQNKKEQIIRAIKKAGAIATYEVGIAQGAHIL